MEQELQFLLYDLPDDSAKVQVVVRDETVWMTQKAMGALFGVQAPAISKHLKNIFESGELNPEVVISKMETTTQHGAIAGKTQTSETNFYNLDAIISVGYRVNSTKATRFRQWATKILNEYIRKGFALNDERLKQGKRVFGQDYFRELLERIRSIRASERRIWQQILPDENNVYHLFPILVGVQCKVYGVRDRLHDYLEQKGIGTVIHYPIAPHKQECYAKEAWNVPQLQLPITEMLADCELSLPISPCMSREQMEYVVECLNQFK